MNYQEFCTLRAFPPWWCISKVGMLDSIWAKLRIVYRLDKSDLLTQLFIHVRWGCAQPTTSTRTQARCQIDYWRVAGETSAPTEEATLV